MKSTLLYQGWMRLFLVAALVFSGLSALDCVPAQAAPAVSGPVVASTEELVNVNTANFEELQSVRGIGPGLAGRIIEYREINGAFDSLDELADVRGIGAAKLQKIKAQAVV